MQKQKRRESERRYRNKNKLKHNTRGRLTARRNRLKILQYYSGDLEPKCAKCGVSDIRVLSIDHINGGGNKHRKELKKQGTSLNQWIINNNFPVGFQVLCMNCQFIKRYEKKEHPCSFRFSNRNLTDFIRI